MAPAQPLRDDETVLVTVARDVYTDVDRRAVYNAIDDLASPLDGMGFASNGVYVFFDPTSRELLYIGLARDLAYRFGQHNGLIKTKPSSCKIGHINGWFEHRDALGYAMLLQSPVYQSKTGRQTGTEMQEYFDEETGVFYEYEPEALTHIRDVEGQLIADVRERQGALPPWNKIASAEHEGNRPGKYTANLLDLTTGAGDSLLVARRTIRELEADPTAYYFEESLHAARLYAATHAAIEGTATTDRLILEGIRFHQQQEMQQALRDANPYLRMIERGYPWGEPPVPADQVPLWQQIPELHP